MKKLYLNFTVLIIAMRTTPYDLKRGKSAKEMRRAKVKKKTPPPTTPLTPENWEYFENNNER